ncbi:MAG: hypothetical protein D6751_01435 [Deltaproteobacteria bacterium]|nr:MAG: hypothetical protein D6751_01435 [Deltaproteobacteria bacterium]
MKPAALIGALWRLNRWVPLLLLLLGLANLALWLYIDRNLAPELAMRERQFIELQDRVRQARRVETASHSPREAFSQGQKDLRRFLDRVPDRKRLSDLIGELYTIARQAGLNIRAVNYQPRLLPEQGLVEYGLSFTVAGDYRQVKEFIHLIEKSDRMVVVDQLNLDRGSREEGAVRLGIRMTTYFRRGAA